MVRLTFKWNFALFFYFGLIITINSLPISNVLHTSEIDLNIKQLNTTGEHNSDVVIIKKTSDEEENVQRPASHLNSTDEKTNVVIVEEEEDAVSEKAISARNSAVRPGQVVTRYVVTLTRSDNNINGRVVLTIEVTAATRPEPIRLHCDGLTIQSVQVGIFSDVNADNANFELGNGQLVITPPQLGTAYVVIIEYTMPLRTDGRGIFFSEFNGVNYIAMNLHPINGRRVFPCVDEPNHLSTIVFSFNDFAYNTLTTNSKLEGNSESQFMPLQGPVHNWGMVAHNLVNVNLPIANVLLYVRPGITNQDQQASAAINFLFSNLNEWTGKPYFEIILNQNEQMRIMALPDTNKDWYALSTVCIWEPYILMETTHSIKQRTTALSTIAEAISRQWFGYAIYPENFRFQWVITGLGKYAAYEVLKIFQNDTLGGDVSLIDMKTIFTTDVIQESLHWDTFADARPMQPNANIFMEREISDTVNGLIKYKAPAIMNMLRITLGEGDQDFIQSAVKALFNRNPLLWVNSVNFYDAINSKWVFEGNEIVPDIAEFANPWVQTSGYPLVHVGLRQGGLILTQEQISFTPATRGTFVIPLTYTTGAVANFDNIYPTMMLEGTTTLTIALGPEDYVLFNIQGQGYYRVNYDLNLWERIIQALYNDEEREKIHPLNRATLIDDSLILARAAKLSYDITLQIVLAMELETEYAPWKAFIRNMEFVRKHLMSFVQDMDLDPDIYLRLLRRVIRTFEEEIGFQPDPNLNVPAMISLTRGLVMDHACRANYDRCIAAAVDWFYDPNNIGQVNPNIPHDIRPAVYCTMVREGDDQVTQALMERLEVEPTMYERLVISEAMACSRNGDFIQQLLQNTIADDGPYGLEERTKIFKAVVESSFENTNAALSFLTRNTIEIREKYGGPEKLDEMIFLVAHNIVHPSQLDQFVIWINSVNSNLQDSLAVARRARDRAMGNMEWHNAHLEGIYQWIEENHAPTLVVSSVLIFMSLCVAILNN